jgi:uncharacterized protein (TIGR01319 family)
MDGPVFGEQIKDYFLLDIVLPSAAVGAAMARHASIAGIIEEVYYPTGKVGIRHGKELMNIRTFIGTGGVFAYGRELRKILQAGCYDLLKPESLRPRYPDFFIDQRYILFAARLISELMPETALKIMKRYF